MQLRVQEVTEQQLDKVDISNRERAIMKLRNGYLDGTPHTLEYVGEVFGVTRERIRQIEGKVVTKIQCNFWKKN